MRIWGGRLGRNAIERGVILTGVPHVGLEHMPAQLTAGVVARIEVGGPVSLVDLEAEHIRRVMDGAASLEEAARILGIDTSTLYRKRKRSVEPPRRES